MFYVCAAIALGGMLIFLVLADGELQTWAVPRDGDYEIRVNDDYAADPPKEKVRETPENSIAVVDNPSTKL